LICTGRLEPENPATTTSIKVIMLFSKGIAPKLLL
jgi:hypothetical protein